MSFETKSRIPISFVRTPLRTSLNQNRERKYGVNKLSMAIIIRRPNVPAELQGILSETSKMDIIKSCNMAL